MGVLTDLIVAPLSDASAVASASQSERSWPWADVKGVGVEDLATIHCLIDGRDPSKLLDGPEWMKNPFTGQKLPVTSDGRYVGGFERVAAEDEVAVLRMPKALVEHLASLDSPKIQDLGRRWSAGHTQCLDSIVAMAKEATARNHDVLVWLSP